MKNLERKKEMALGSCLTAVGLMKIERKKRDGEMALGSWIAPHGTSKKTVSDKAFDKDLEKGR
jgi:hypothetical protein